MSYSNKASQEYLRGAVLTASPEQLQLMLIDGAIRFAVRGQQALRDNDIEMAFNSLDRAQRIVLELHAGLRRDVNPALVDQMAGLYHFIYRRLVDGGTMRDPEPIDESLRILRHQRETWSILIDKVKREGSPPARGGSAPSGDADHPPTLSLEG